MSALPRLSWRAVLGYWLGDMANNFSFALGLLFLLHYYTDVAGIPAAAAGSLLVVVRIYDAFADIVAGRIIDASSAHPRWGRLRPWLLYGGVPALLLNVAVFSVPSGWSEAARLAYAGISYALLGTAYAFASIAYGSLAGVMTQSPPARARLGAARAWMAGLTFALLAFLVAPVLRGLQGDALQARLSALTLMLAVAGIVLYLNCFFSTRETVPRPRRAIRWRDCMAALRRNPPLQRLGLVTFAALLASGSGSASGIYYARYVLGDAGMFFFMILGTSLAGLVFAVPLAPWVAARVGKARAFQFGMALAACGHLALWWTGGVSLGWAMACLMLGALGSTLAMALLWALEADTVEYGEWRSGLRLEGTNYALFLLMRKCGLAFGGAMPAFMLASSDYVPNLALQGKAALQAIHYGMALLPALGFGAAGLLMLRYPLTEARFLTLIAALARRKPVD